MYKDRIISSLLIASLFLLAGLGYADVRIKQRVYTGHVFGQQEKDIQTVIYITDRWVRQDMGEKTSWLLDTQKDEFFFINHDRKEYAEVDFEQVEKMLKSTSPFLGEAESKLEKTGKSIKVNNWDAKKYKLSIKANTFRINLDLYVYSRISLPASYRKFQDKWSRFAGPLAKVMEQVRELEGFVVKSDGTLFFMGQTVKFSNEALEISEDIIDPEILKLPEHYEKIKFNIWDIL